MQEVEAASSPKRGSYLNYEERNGYAPSNGQRRSPTLTVAWLCLQPRTLARPRCWELAPPSPSITASDYHDNWVYQQGVFVQRSSSFGVLDLTAGAGHFA